MGRLGTEQVCGPGDRGWGTGGWGSEAQEAFLAESGLCKPKVSASHAGECAFQCFL